MECRMMTKIVAITGAVVATAIGYVCTILAYREFSEVAKMLDAHADSAALGLRGFEEL